MQGHRRLGLITQRKEDSLTGNFMMFDFPIQGGGEKGGRRVREGEDEANRRQQREYPNNDKDEEMPGGHHHLNVLSFFFCFNEGRRMLTCNNKEPLKGLSVFFGGGAILGWGCHTLAALTHLKITA